jgi:hypothetical protein
MRAPEAFLIPTLEPGNPWMLLSESALKVWCAVNAAGAPAQALPEQLWPPP